MSVKKDVTRTEIVTRRLVMEGLTEIMFDRYSGDNSTQLEPHQKLYFAADGKTLVLPALNLMSLLSAHNTNSAPKRLLDKRKYKDAANACLSFITISPTHLTFLREGKPIQFGRLDKDVDATSGVYIHRSVARLDKGIPNPKVRPVLPLPWSLECTMTIYPNKEIQEQQILNLLEAGGMALGLGTFRGVFGKFRVETWE